MAVDPSSLLNGDAGYPVWGSVQADMSTQPSHGLLAGGGRTTSPQAVLVAWVALVVVLVLMHVLTMDLQR